MNSSSSSASFSIEQIDAPLGVVVRDLDLTQPLDALTLSALRSTWLQHQLLVMPNQAISIPDLERFAHGMGPYGEDPYFEAMPGHPHVAQVRRAADETTRIFAEAWHSDWSFMASPPAATVLLGSIIPPHGGNTLFSNQYAAWDALPDDVKSRLRDAKGIHSARRGYARDGAYGEKDREAGRSMAIRFDDSALKTQLQPIARVHPETGRTALYVSPGYTLGIEGWSENDSQEMMMFLFEHQTRSEFVYSHRWSPDTLLMWDNRCLIHAATGGYEGHRRLLHRITIAERAAASP
jgi:taurine dioxygenase